MCRKATLPGRAREFRTTHCQGNADVNDNTISQQQTRVRVIDWAMLALAVFSVALLSWETFADLPPELTRRIILTDYVVCGVFFLEFLWRWRAEGWRRDFILRNWYEILGMIPVSEPALRAFRLIRIVRIVVLLSRVGRAADRALGDEFTYRLVNRFSKGIINAIKRPITIAMLDEVGDVLQKGHYTQHVATVLDSRREQLVATIVDQVARDPAASRFSRLPFFRDITRLSADTSLRLVNEILVDERTDGLIADILQETLRQISDEVRKRDRAAKISGHDPIEDSDRSN